jgi:hypothetical protein
MATYCTRDLTSKRIKANQLEEGLLPFYYSSYFTVPSIANALSIIT